VTSPDRAATPRTTTPSPAGGAPTLTRFTSTSVLIRGITTAQAHYLTDQVTAHITELTIDSAAIPTGSADRGVDVQHGIGSLLITHPHITKLIPTLTGLLNTPPPPTPATTTPAATAGAVTHHIIPVTYNGDDLTHAATTVNLTAIELAAAHARTLWRVDAIGFAPGFAYLTPEGPDQDLWSRLPRHATPRQQVPAGSVAVAAGRSAIYPASMPGGWNLLGATTVTLFDPTNTHNPALFTPGDTLTFHPHVVHTPEDTR